MHDDRTLAEMFFKYIRKGSFGMLSQTPSEAFFYLCNCFAVNTSFFKPHYADNVVFIFVKISLFTTISTRSRTSSSVVLT